jgi:hypothetical protein
VDALLVAVVEDALDDTDVELAEADVAVEDVVAEDVVAEDVVAEDVETPLVDAALFVVATVDADEIADDPDALDAVVELAPAPPLPAASLTEPLQLKLASQTRPIATKVVTWSERLRSTSPLAISAS